MATQLSIYNGALLVLGEDRLATTSDDVPHRYTLDERYSKAVADCLEAGLWDFAIRTSEEASDGTPTVHDFAFYFTKPTDWVRTAMVSASPSFDPPLMRYEDEGGKIYTDVDPIYLKYISNHATLGGGLLSAWPASFETYVQNYLAFLCHKRITGSDPRPEFMRELRNSMKTTKAHDAMNGPPRFPPTGRLVQSRAGNISIRRYDRG